MLSLVLLLGIWLALGFGEWLGHRRRRRARTKAYLPRRVG